MGKNRCKPSVKDVVKSFHRKCCHDRPLVQVFGQDLNAALDLSDFERNKKYCICRSLYNHKIQPALEKLQEENQNNENANPNVAECTNDTGITANP